MKKEIIIKIIKIVFITWFILLVTIQLYQRILPNSKGFLGFRTYVIVSSSMEPYLHIGDVILVRDTNPDKVKLKDLISYQGESKEYKNKIITHQVVNIKKEDGRYIYYTKGTKNKTIDPAVYEEQVYGVMKYKFFILSIISKMIRTTIGFIILVITPLAILLISEIRSITKEIDERR